MNSCRLRVSAFVSPNPEPSGPETYRFCRGSCLLVFARLLYQSEVNLWGKGQEQPKPCKEIYTVSDGLGSGGFSAEGNFGSLGSKGEHPKAAIIIRSAQLVSKISLHESFHRENFASKQL